MLKILATVLFLFSYSFSSIDIKPFRISYIKIVAPKFIDRDEIFYLLGFKAGDIVDNKVLKNAAFYLKQKKLFKNIRFKFKNFDSDSKKLKLYLNPSWRFMGLRVKGLYFWGVDMVYSYPLHIGFPFNLKKHSQFLKSLKYSFYKKGYLGINISSSLKRDIKKKEVRALVDVKLGKQFFLQDILFRVNDISIQKILTKKFNIISLKKRFSFKLLKQINNFIKKTLAKKGYFASKVKIDVFKLDNSNRVNLVCIVDLGSFMNLNLIGNNFFSTSYIYKNILKKNLDFPLEVMISDLKGRYKKEGFFDIKVDIDLDAQSLTVDEGQRYKIHKLKFNNVSLFSDKQLLKKFKPVLNSFYSKSSLDQIIDAISLDYLKQGYWDFYVADYHVEQEQDKNVLNLTFYEGFRRILRSSQVENYPEIKLNNKYPTPFDLSLLSLQEREIVKFFNFRGVTNIKVKPKFKDGKEIDIVWHVDEKDRDFNIGKFVLNTNTGINFKNFKKEVEHVLKNRNKIKYLSSVFNRLKSLDSFEYLNVNSLNSLDEFGNKPWVINGINTCKLELKTRLGFQKVNSFKLADIRNRSTYKLGGGFVIRNPLNKGDKFTFDSDFTIFYRHLTAQYSLPFLFDLPVRTIFRLSIDKFYQPLFKGSDNSLYKVSHQSAMSGLSYDFNDFTIFKLGQGFEFRRLSDVSLDSIDSLKISPILLNNRIPYLFAEPNYFFERIDNKLNPSKGFYTLISFKGIKALKDNNLSYARLLAEASAFIPLFKKNIICASRLRVGKIVAGKFEAVLPPERFYLGGANSLRSYPTDFAPPLVNVKLCDAPLEAPMGGDFMFNSNLELRFNLIKNFSVVLFQDLGLLSNPYKKSGLLMANGFGLRYLTPVGPVRFDIGFRPKSNIIEKNFAWFLTVGQAF